MILPPEDPTSTETEICELLAALIRVSRPRVVVEAGTYLGIAAVHMADACRRNGYGHVWTYDPVNTRMDLLLAENDLTEWCTYVQADYAATGSPVDFAFIDASADDETGARLREQHFLATLDRLSPKGIICLHDTRADIGGVSPQDRHGTWRDGKGGKTMYRIRDKCQLNLDHMRGLSIYSNG